MYRVSKFGHELSQLQLGQANRAGGRGGRGGRGEGLQVEGPIAERRAKDRERKERERERTGPKGQ